MQQSQLCKPRHNSRVVDNIWYVVLVNQVRVPYDPIRLTSPSFTRRRWWSQNKMYNVIGALRGCHAVKFNSCNNLRSSIHTILVIILRSVSLRMKQKLLLLLLLLLSRPLHLLAVLRVTLGNEQTRQGALECRIIIIIIIIIINATLLLLLLLTNEVDHKAEE